MNDSFQSVKNENNQSMRNDQSLRDENFGQKNRNMKKNQLSPAESLQSVISNQETTYQVDQVASTHAAKAEIDLADENAEHFVLMSESQNLNQFKAVESETINQVDQLIADQAANQAKLMTDNQLISEKHNSLILN